MHQSKWVWAPAVVVIAVVGIAYWRSGRAPDAGRTQRSGTAADPTATEATAPPDEDALRAAMILVRDLSSDDPMSRDAARTRLGTWPAEDRGSLQAAARDTADPDVRQRVDARLAEMDEELALHPPLVSLHVQGERLAEVLSELNGELGTTMDTVTFDNQSHPPFTLDMDKRPFWEIMTALNDQHPIYIADVRPDKHLYFYDGTPGMENPVIRGSFLFYTRWLPSPAQKAGEKRRVALGLATAADPRLRVFEMEDTLGPLNDELGNVLHATPRNASDLSDYRKFSTANSCPRIVDIDLPEDAGGKIVSLKVHVRAWIALHVVETDLEDVEAFDGKTIVLGNTTVQLSAKRMDPKVNQQVMVTGHATSTGGKPHVLYEFHDPTDLILFRWGGMENSGYSSGIRPGPYKMHLSAAQKTQEVNLDFEVKYLAIPPP